MTRQTMRFVLACACILIGAAFMMGLFVLTVPESNQRSLALSFYFGTSESSAHKTDVMADRPTGRPGDPVHTEEED